ncbi:MgtC/SapB family protein [Guyparkeria hydrothermalis]|uniref:MgtC/SapB family protein n=1 Tax=Guyparkeria hydrothermalis TaxID=923 RepID=UPI0020224350|nr:MgtC/SapB family protein [Guyparkeria hydrothermalis]MCL7743594.1 MgtC/SapB family protein [Guyparkeria hydrothermalis]
MTFDIDWSSVYWNLSFLAAAYVLALPVGFERERHSRSAGLRTFPLVAVASCAYMLLGINVLESSTAEARVFEGIITGMGFIGGGAILKNRDYTTGTATAASLWATGGIGVAVAWNHFEVALLLSVVTFVSLRLLSSAKPVINGERRDTEKESDRASRQDD